MFVATVFVTLSPAFTQVDSVLRHHSSAQGLLFHDGSTQAQSIRLRREFIPSSPPSGVLSMGGMTWLRQHTCLRIVASNY
jgi:hypothetical protein